MEYIKSLKLVIQRNIFLRFLYLKAQFKGHNVKVGYECIGRRYSEEAYCHITNTTYICIIIEMKQKTFIREQKVLENELCHT